MTTPAKKAAKRKPNGIVPQCRLRVLQSRKKKGADGARLKLEIDMDGGSARHLAARIVQLMR